MKLSILLRNLNEGNYLRQFLHSLSKQIIHDPYEIVVVDNESDDESLTILKDFSCRLITIPRMEFTYGGALNTGISQCKGEYIFIASPHICLRSYNFLQQTVLYLDNDKNAAGLRFTQPGQAYKSPLCIKEFNTLTYEDA